MSIDRVGRIVRLYVWTAVVVGILSAPAAAQTAQISGVVKDQSGSIIPQATVTVVSESTNAQRVVKTSDEGFYAVPLLSPGAYRVLVAAQGFQSLSRSGLALEVGQHARLDLALSVGVQEDTVIVEGGASLVNSSSAAVGMVINASAVERMPLNGRTFQSLLLLSPGVTLPTATGFSGQVSVNGQRTMSNYFSVDGVSANLGIDPLGLGVGQAGSGASPGLSASGGTNTLVSMDAFQEVRVLTSSFAPEYGRMPGANVSIVTRSGTNDLRGTAFEYFRTDKLDATDWFVSSRSGLKPTTRYHNFGGSMGGPIALSRAFFFGSYEGQRLDQPFSVISQVPSLEARNAAATDLRPFLDGFPLPNGPNGANGLAELSAAFARPSNLDAASVRVDVSLPRSHTLFARFSDGRSRTVSRGGPVGFNALNYLQIDSTRTRTTTAGLTSVLTRSLVNDLRVNYSTHRAAVTSDIDDYNGAVPFSPDLLLPPGTPLDETSIEFNLLFGAGSGMLLGRVGGSEQQQVNVVDTLSYVRGSHELKFGVDYRRLTPEPSPPRQRYGYQFTGGLPQLLQHRVRATVGLAIPARPLFQNFSAFAQDAYRVSSPLTLTYGVRYELNPAPSSLNDTHPLLVTGIEDPAQLRVLPDGTELWETSWTNIAPRVGAVYRIVSTPGRETVLRTGWGMFFDLGTGRAGNAFGGGYPYRNARQFDQTNFPLAPEQFAPPVGDPTVAGVNEVYAFSQELKLPVTHQWNVSVERALGAIQSLSVAYVGAAGRDLLDQATYLLARVNPEFQTVQAIGNTGTSDYHALQVHYQRRMSKGLQGLLSYTWGHSIDTDSGEGGTTLPPVAYLPPQGQRGSSDFDIRHSLNFAVSYEVPTRGLPAVARTILRDWQLDLVGYFRTGMTLTPIVRRDLGFGSYFFRPDLVAGVPVYLDDPSVAGGRRINSQAFTVPTELRQGTLGRNTLRGPGLRQIDMALSRSLPFAGLNTIVRIEAFNVFNIPNFGRPDAELTGAFFGTSTRTLANSLGRGSLLQGGTNPIHQVGGARSVQLSLRVRF